jgi:transposase
MEDDMGAVAALDVSQEKTAICTADARGAILAEGKVATCPHAIAHWLKRWSQEFEKIGMETGPLAVWLWNPLAAQGLPIVVLDARHASAALKMMPNKTDRREARARADCAHWLVQGDADQEPWRS